MIPHRIAIQTALEAKLLELAEERRARLEAEKLEDEAFSKKFLADAMEARVRRHPLLQLQRHFNLRIFESGTEESIYVALLTRLSCSFGVPRSPGAA